MDGIAATTELIKLMNEQDPSKELSFIPIIGCSAYGQEKETCLSIGMKHFLTKPLTAQVIYETIEKFIY